MYIAVDFDGTVVSHMYPEVGEDNPMAEEVLKELVNNNHKLILYTMRPDEYLEDAINWYKEKGIELWDINNNRSQKFWTNSPKVYANLYIDDSALGTPLIYDEVSGRDKVDWLKVKELLIKKNII
ncbi:MAG: hypothetical protein ACOC3V_02260 [bacterium]